MADAPIEPTDEEVAAAQQVLAAKAAAQAARVAEHYGPLQELMGSDQFAFVSEKAEALKVKFPPNGKDPFYAGLNALTTGCNVLRDNLAKIPTPTAPEA